MGKDYIDRVTESQAQVGEQAAEWLVKTLNGKGNIIMFGGTPGNPMTAAQVIGWKPYFAKYPGIKVLEAEPVPTNVGSGGGAAEDRCVDRQISRRSTASTVKPLDRSAPSLPPAGRFPLMSVSRSWT